jgi:uncharacterized protein YdaU (DUF1376 family)
MKNQRRNIVSVKTRASDDEILTHQLTAHYKPFDSKEANKMDNLPEKIEMPYFRVFPRDEIADSRIQLLELNEFGAYQRLKYQIWIDGGNLPFDEKILAKILKISPKKFQKIWEKISPLFFVVDEKVTVFDFQIQRAKYSEVIEQKRIAGQKSAASRANIRSTPVEHPLNGRSTIPEAEAEADADADIKQRDARECVRESRFNLKDKIGWAEWLPGIDNPPAFANSKKVASGECDDEIADWIKAGRPEKPRNGNAAANVGAPIETENPDLSFSTVKKIKGVAQAILPGIIEYAPFDELKRAAAPHVENGLSDDEQKFLWSEIENELEKKGFDFDQDRNRLFLKFTGAI